MFRGSEGIRLIAMIGTLCIMGMIVFRSHSPEPKNVPVGDGEETASLEKEKDSADKEKASLEKEKDTADKEKASLEKEKDSPNKEKSQEKQEKTSQGPENNSEQKGASSETVTPGPTDEDSEEIGEAQMEYQAVNDGTLGIRDYEMPAYRRTMAWVEHQSFADLKKRVKNPPRFDEFMRKPDHYRGQLVEVDLSVRQVVRDTRRILFDGDLYELWGFSEDSRSWLYCVVTPYLPEGFPIGTNVEERVRVVGYFFKIQGYHPAIGKPQDAPSKAPVLLGRIKHLEVKVKKPSSSEDEWLYLAAGGFVLLSMIYTAMTLITRRRAKVRQVQLDRQKTQQVQHWLSQEELPFDEKSSDEGEEIPYYGEGRESREKPSE